MDTVAAPSPWHEGERTLQRTLGAEQRMDEIGRKVIRRYMPDQHRDFFAQLPFAVMGAVDPQGMPWATLRAGQPGFLHSPDPETLTLALPRVPQDPADAGMEDGDAIGLLGIELHTRRRNRVNGTLHRPAQGPAHLSVAESFGNCPQYITLRQVSAAPAADERQELPALDDAAHALIAGAATFFVATYSDEGERRVDVSHRGGAPGFVQLSPDGSVLVPDYEGNRFFSTLGNMLLNGKAGLVFVDFGQGSLLQLSGEAQVLVDGDQRSWRFQPRRIVRRAQALPLRWNSTS
ncbi:pyridoxamine 5'-phosphate oxidase family protein [Massilia endophytica]|uniref:pyridoxamine 5'-phosphate oxidase family protein n=1 Tax=Massilia endophytica TaxID=2899220 RepID=UPI001E2D69F2|nr:pyridoxamine 5'-phosphate oxidase family protein [Massilia endophytica]UGQ49067.1 pyridoxamine 5'-phosphate oxidase family protein [Massilia endophytica]